MPRDGIGPSNQAAVAPPATTMPWHAATRFSFRCTFVYLLLYALASPQLGSYTPQQFLWLFIGVSPGYERFAGCVECLDGALLFVPQLTTLAALLATMALTQVFALNVFYDVHVKLFSLHLLLMACFLLLPDVRRLADVFLFNRATGRDDTRQFAARERTIMKRVLFFVQPAR